MKIRYYLYTSGTLSRQDDSLVFVDNKENKHYLPIFQIDSILIFSHITLNKNTIGILNENKIPIYFFNYYGNYIGSYQPSNPKIGQVQIAQYENYRDSSKREFVAQEIILSSLLNCLAVMKYYDKKYGMLSQDISKLKNIVNSLNTPLSNDQILICEANGKQAYYESFDKIIKNKDFLFEKRSKNPPKNAVNAMMSYGYTILYSIISTAIYSSDLQISIPFIHSARRRKEGLQYDIADIFKPIIIDRIIMRIINKKQINASDFVEYQNGIYLNKKGVTIFTNEIETFLKSTVKVNIKKSMNYNQIINQEVHKIIKHLIGKQTYHGYRMGW